jgi:2-hydroxychromene-2-carboxylate isomerase
MSKRIDYYFSISSPWSYLGHQRFLDLAREHAAEIVPRVMDLTKVFPGSGGLPVAKRAPQRQAYRMVELKRWQKETGVPLNPSPKFHPIKGDPGAMFVLAAMEKHGMAPALALAGAFMRAAWAEEQDIGDAAVLKAATVAQGLDADALHAQSLKPETQATYDRMTQEAVAAQVFGAPWYVYNGEPFWGQDRLGLLAKALGGPQASV